MSRIRQLSAAVALFALLPGFACAQPAGRITGVGGIFFKSKDPKALMAWYRDVLGIKVEAWGGALMSYAAPSHPPAVTVTAFRVSSDMMNPSTREFMINFAVDDLDAFVARLKTKEVAILKRDDTDPYGRFAWIVDPDGTKIELWEPRRSERMQELEATSHDAGDGAGCLRSRHVAERLCREAQRLGSPGPRDAAAARVYGSATAAARPGSGDVDFPRSAHLLDRSRPARARWGPYPVHRRGTRVGSRIRRIRTARRNADARLFGA